MMVIAHNLMAWNAERQYNIVVDRRRKSTEKLASGYRINQAADDAAGLTITEKMRRQIRGLAKGEQNIQDGISLIQVTDGALAEMNDMIHRMSELAIQASNDTNTANDRAALQQEITSIIDEIDRISYTTTFNTHHVFDDVDDEFLDGAITKLVSSPGADTGFLTESYKYGSRYYPSASLDFSKINSKNIDRLNNGSFSFTCSQSCPEAFDITFKTDGTPSSASNLKGSVRHYYTVDISNCKSGKDVVDAVYSYVEANLPNTAGASVMGGLGVSHSNELVKGAGGDCLIVAARSGYTSAARAESEFPRADKIYGAITYTELVGRNDEPRRTYNIQCSSNSDDSLFIYTKQINSNILRIKGMDVRSYNSAQKAISACAWADNYVSKTRSLMGAQQNRLEHALKSDKNTEENTQAAESRLRDADIAKEMCEYSKTMILSQIGEAMIAHSKQSVDGVLAILG